MNPFDPTSFASDLFTQVTTTVLPDDYFDKPSLLHSPSRGRPISPRKSSNKATKKTLLIQLEAARDEISELKLQDTTNKNNQELEEAKAEISFLKARVGMFEINEIVVKEMVRNNNEIFNNWLYWKQQADAFEKTLETEKLKSDAQKAMITELQSIIQRHSNVKTIKERLK